MKTRILIAIFLGGFLAGCVPTTDSRIRSEFGIGAHDAMGTNEIRSAILKSVPVGTPAEEVLVCLRQRTAADKRATVSANTDGINCRIDYDPNSSGIVKKSYSIQILLDGQRKLKDVQVEEWLTGP